MGLSVRGKHRDMSEFDDLDEAYSKAPKPSLIPPGRYHVRAVSAKAAKAQRTPAKGISVQFVVVDGSRRGQLLSDTFWLSEKAISISKENLDTIGFEGMRPTEIVALTDFATLPTVQVDVRVKEFEGRPRTELGGYRRMNPSPGAPGEGS